MFRTMGERTAMNTARRSAKRRSRGPFDGLLELLPVDSDGVASQRRPKARKRVAHLKFDVPLLLSVITLLIFGLIMVYSASYDYSLYWYGNRTTIFVRQVAWLGLGLAAAGVLAFLEYHRWGKLVVFAMGITKDRKVRILAFQHAWQESADEWQSFTQSLYERGLKGSSLRAVVVDEAAAIAGAVSLLWPEALLQLCMFHKMRNLVMSIKRSPLKKLIITDARAIWKTTSRADAIARISRFRHKWAKSHPKAVRNLLRNIDLTLSYLSLPPPMWVKARTTNLLDRFFREIRRRINPMGPFLDRYSASRILFAIADTYNNDRMEKENRPVKTSQPKSLKTTSAHF